MTKARSYIEFTDEDRAVIVDRFKSWRLEGYQTPYEDIPEFCYAAKKDEIIEKDYSLVPSRYIEFVQAGEDVNYDEKMTQLQSELQKLLVQEQQSRQDLLKVMKGLGLSFEERLQSIIDDYNNRMTDADYIKSILDNVADQLLDLLNQLKDEENSFSAMGIDYEEKAFYDILVAVAEKFQFEYPDDKNIELAKEIRAALRDKEKYSDWANSMQIKALMQADIIMILAKHGYPPVPPEIYEKVYNDILEQTENFKKYSDD